LTRFGGGPAAAGKHGALDAKAPGQRLALADGRGRSPEGGRGGDRPYGFNNEVIEVFKFRSMYVERCDKAIGAAVVQATKSDPRVTRLGRILRRTSLDELPQFINVLMGTMSIVGPRPHAVSHNEQYARVIDEYLARHRVKPGITGWAQVNGLRGETESLEKMAQRVRYDLYYIENWSLLFDIRIILRTLFVGFVHHNAY
jgi:putative colanic acid biosynthesis UDP-glucose lipid carrier transferase